MQKKLPRELWIRILEIKHAAFENNALRAIERVLSKTPDMASWTYKDIQKHVMHDVCKHSKNPVYSIFKDKPGQYYMECTGCKKPDCSPKTPTRKKCIERWEIKNNCFAKYLLKAKIEYRLQQGLPLGLIQMFL